MRNSQIEINRNWKTKLSLSHTHTHTKQQQKLTRQQLTEAKRQQWQLAQADRQQDIWQKWTDGRQHHQKWTETVQHLTKKCEKNDNNQQKWTGSDIQQYNTQQKDNDHQKWAEGDRQQDNNHQKYAEGNSNRKQWQTARQCWTEVNRLQDWQSCGQQKAGTVPEAENKNQPFHSGSTLVSVGESPDTSGSEAVNQSITWTCVNAFHSLTHFSSSSCILSPYILTEYQQSDTTEMWSCVSIFLIFLSH